MKFFLVINALCIFCLQLSAQERPLTGRVYERSTRTPLAGITVVNPGAGNQAKTDSNGTFQIRAAVGHILIFSGLHYRTDSVLVIDHHPREIFMRPAQHELKEVTISSATPNLGEYRHPEFHGQTVVYQRDEDGNFKGGLAFRISYWKKDSRKERRSKKKLELAETLAQIDALFTPGNIGRYIPLKDKELQNFTELYRPSVELYRSPQFNLLVYLSAKYREFLALPEEKRRLPPLR